MPAAPTTAVGQLVNLLLVPLPKCVKGNSVGRIEGMLSIGSGRSPCITGREWNYGSDRARCRSG